MSGNALRWVLDGDVAVVVLDLPGRPVNLISRAVKDEFITTFETLAQDPSVAGVVFLSGKADSFIAGADIDELAQLDSAAAAERLAAEGQEMLDGIAAFPKPVVVGIHGACLGGGLEFSLACQYRVATDHPKTQLGLPEVQLGLLPGAGGCQRLPRLIGTRAALDLILTGRPERAAKAFRIGLVDELVPPAILRGVSLAAARRLIGGWQPKRRHGSALLDGNPLGRALVFRGARRQVLARTGGHYPAPLAALDAVRHGLRHGVPAGLKREAELFGQLAVTDVSRKLVQIFFATADLKKNSGVPTSEPPVDVSRLGVVGAGFMGSGIAATAVIQAGVDVRLKDADLPRVAAGLRAARRVLDSRLARRRLDRHEYARRVALLSGGDHYAGFGRAGIVIEAVFEELEVKRTVLREVERAVGPRVIFASNTSTIPIARIAEGAERPERVVGMHFFSPVDRMPLLEVIPHAGTAPWVTNTAVAFGRRLGKTVIVVQDAPGFWVNRILGPYLNEAVQLVLSGVAIEEVDQLMVEFGFPVGPLTLLDEVGLDVAAKAAGVLYEAFGSRVAPAPGIKQMVDAGHLGRKSGSGFYTYRGGKRAGAHRAAYELLATTPNGGPRPAEVIQRLLYTMINEAARAVGEGVVHQARDGDVGALFGIGFPPFRGGPLRHADDLGASRLVLELERLTERCGPRFEPCEALREQARAGTKFYS